MKVIHYSYFTVNYKKQQTREKTTVIFSWHVELARGRFLKTYQLRKKLIWNNKHFFLVLLEYIQKSCHWQIENLKHQSDRIYIYMKRKIMSKLNIHLKLVLASYQVWLLWQKSWEFFEENKHFDTCHIIFYSNRILILIFTQPVLEQIRNSAILFSCPIYRQFYSKRDFKKYHFDNFNNVFFFVKVLLIMICGLWTGHTYVNW